MPLDADDLAMFVDDDMPGYVDAIINGDPVPGLFGAAYAESFGLVNGSKPALRVLGSVGVSRDDTVVIDTVHYTVSSIERPHIGSRIQILHLEAA